jgi:hypothetical protein
MCIDSITVCFKEQDFIQGQVVLCISSVKDEFLRGVDHFAHRLLHIRNLFRQSPAPDQYFVLWESLIDFNFDFHNFFALSFSPLMGWLTGLIYHGLRKTKIPSAASVTIASLCCPLLNTTFFMGTLVTLFASTMRESFGMGKVLPFIFAFVGVNGVVEAIVCFVVGTAISMALKKALRYN